MNYSYEEFLRAQRRRERLALAACSFVVGALVAAIARYAGLF